MPASYFTCPKCGTKTTLKRIEANNYACTNSRCLLADRLLVHGEFNPSGTVKKIYGWVLEKGTVLKNRYTIEKLLGKGGFGATYLATDKEMFNQPRAIKELPNLYFDEKEEEFLTILNHSSIPTLFERFNVDILHYSVMEYVEGKGLDEIIQKNKNGLSEAMIFPLAEQLCDVLSYIHSQNVIHRDLKPENILVRKDNTISLIDFGIAKQYSVGEGTRYLARAASSFFSSPEQYQAGKGYTDVKSDIYSLGAILYYIYTGREPADSLSRDPAKDITPLPRELNSQIPVKVQEVIVKALKMNKKERYSTIAQFKKELMGQKGATQKRCSRCGKQIEDSAKFCAHCGQATDRLPESAGEPFIFRTGEQVYTTQELVQTCYKRWEDAKWHFLRGDFEEWLENRKENVLAKKSRQLRKSKQDADILLNELLQLSKFAIPPELTVTPTKINLKNIQRGIEKQIRLTILNSGKGILKGTMTSSKEWIQLSTPEFRCRGGESIELVLNLKTHDLSNFKTYPAKIEIRSNAANLSIPIQLEVSPPPARPQISPERILLQVKPGQSIKTTILAKNVGNDENLNWQVLSQRTWIKIPQQNFKASEKKIPLEISAKDLKEGTYNGTILVQCNSMQLPVNIDLVVSPGARKMSSLHEKFARFRLFIYPLLICLLMGAMIGQFGVDTPSGTSPVWMILFFTILGALIGVQFNWYVFLAGLISGIAFGIFSQQILSHVYTLMQQQVLLPIYQSSGVTLTTLLMFFHWGLIGLFVGSLVGLVRIAMERHYRWVTMLLLLLGTILIFIICFLGLPMVLSMALF
ncbi:protein kinase [candidate division KSB1 bacterium]|nr:protein kinase [candidate division KSB1 bacterium]